MQGSSSGASDDDSLTTPNSSSEIIQLFNLNSSTTTTTANNTTTTTTANTQRNNIECIICLNSPPSISHLSMTLPCYHYNFCTHCIATWLQRSEKCPLCNSIVTHLIHDIFSSKQFQITNLNNLNQENQEISGIIESMPQHSFRHFIYFANDPIYTIYNSNIHKKKKINENLLVVEERILNFLKIELETVTRSFNIQILKLHIESLLKSKEFHFTKLINDWLPKNGNYQFGDLILKFKKEIEKYLKEFTNHFIHELLLFIMSNINQPEKYNSLVEYQRYSLLLNFN